MTRILAITNQKGGVGKTTTTINLAASLAAAGDAVLLVDLDPQGNATMGSGVDKHGLAVTVCDLLLEPERPATDAVVRADAAGYDLLPANTDLTAAEVGLLERPGREFVLRERLRMLADRYSWILIDCPPSLSILTINALTAADGVLIPMQCEYYALEGLSALLETVDAVREHSNPGLEIEGLLRTMYDPRNSLTRDVSRQLLGHFGDRVYRTVIPRNVRLAEAPSHGLPALAYDRHSRGAVAYQALAAELRRRHRRDDSGAPTPAHPSSP
ncbi:MAG: ParA family protein [Pseudomonadales bacterium]|jgi:chromosome partitioning protein|nr:ParA family protein [Pseudomonadales bacterium]